MTSLLVLAGLLVCSFGGAWAWLWRRARFVRLPVARRPLEQRAEGSVRGVAFPAHDGTLLDGWLFLPKIPDAPIVIMAPGLGATKDGFLEDFAWRFAEAGIAALVFDYRCFGGSDGLPRHWVDPARHQQDYEAAIRWVQRTLAGHGEVDADRIGLWGSSFSGGTAIVTAAAQADVRALVVQCPFLETPARLQPRGLALARFVLWTTLDLLRVLPPIYVPLFGRPGEWAFCTSDENPSVADFHGSLGAPFWRALPQPGLGGWQNRMLARMLAHIDAFVPMTSVEAVRCPTLFVAARDDDMVPLAFVEAAHARAQAGELRVFPGGHFSLYRGAPHAENAAAQATFLARHLVSTSSILARQQA